MFFSYQLEELGMGNPWKRWNRKMRFSKLDEEEIEDSQKMKQTLPPSEPEITPAPPTTSESAPLLIPDSEIIGGTPTAPDLLSGPDPTLVTAPAPTPPLGRRLSTNPFDSHSMHDMPSATPVYGRNPAMAPYYTVKFTGGGGTPSIQLPPVPTPYGAGYSQGGGMPPHGGRYGRQGGGYPSDDDDDGKKSEASEATVVDIKEEEKEEEPKRKSPVKDQPFFITLLFAVTILVMFIHLPLGIMIGNYMRSVSLTIMVGPVGAVIGLLAVYITPCECVATREQAVGRIRYMSMVGIILDAIGAIVMPLALYSMECPGRDGEPYNNSCQFMRIPAQGVGMAAGICTGLHLFLMIVVRGSAEKLSHLVGGEFKDEEEEEDDKDKSDSDSDSDDDSDSDSEDEKEKKRKEEERKKKEKAKKKKEKEEKKKEAKKKDNKKDKKKDNKKKDNKKDKKKGRK